MRTCPEGRSQPAQARPRAHQARQGRRGGGENFFALWADDVHSLGNYSFAIGLFALGLGTWQILLALRDAVFYLVVADRSRTYIDVSGESIAVESNH